MKLDYSIIIPVFNKAALTRQCLSTLQPTLEGAGSGEVIVIDNASSDETPQMLEHFPWVKVVRNERNLGFSGANNQGARLAQGEFLVLLNNDTQAHPGWLAALLARAREPGVGAVGARLLFPDGTIQHAGVVIRPSRVGLAGFMPFHDLLGVRGDHPQVFASKDLQVVTGACLVTPRELYLETGGLDEGFWNGYEDVDYCLRLGARGLRIVYEGRAVVTHFESQSGMQRFRRVTPNVARLNSRWNGRVTYDVNEQHLKRGQVYRIQRVSNGNAIAELSLTPKTTIVCHGELSRAGDAEFERALRANAAPVERIVWVDSAQAVDTVRHEMEARGDRYLALVDARCELQPGWLDELVRQLEWRNGVGAATFAPELPLGEDIAPLAADGRCTLLSLRKFPLHHRLANFPSLDGAVADFVIRALEYRAGTRGAAKAMARVPALARDGEFESVHGMSLTEAIRVSPEAVEQRLKLSPRRRNGLVSIVMLSWNAPQFTKMALESIRAHTSGDYEVIIVDNGSDEQTVQWLHTLQDVRVIYNASNRGYAGGNNQAMAAANGEYVVLLNNDVIVTDGWLEGLLSAFDRIPALGVSAPRSNKIAGDQIVLDATYNSIEEMHRYAAQRRKRYHRHGYMTDRAIGLCLCIDRRVIEEIGGIDERFGVGNFEDDDFCLRVRAAGYGIHVCDDVFIHHFGSQTFAANKVDYTATMRENWEKFAAKWQLPPKRPDEGYLPGPAIRRGFDRARHYVALPVSDRETAAAARAYDLVFAAIVRDERDWNEVGAFARRYIRAFSAQHPVLLAIAAAGDVPAQTIGQRLERLAQREGLSGAAVADVEVSDEDSVQAWLQSFDPSSLRPIEQIEDRSPSALRRLISVEAVG